MKCLMRDSGCLIPVLLQNAETQTSCNENNDHGVKENQCEVSNSGDIKKEASQANLHSARSTELIPPPSNGGNIVHDLDAPIPCLDDKLKRLSWHSSMTSYVAWRHTSPYVPSPDSSPAVERRPTSSEGPEAV